MDISSRFVALRSEYIAARFSGLNPMQQQAVYNTRGPLLILAGAGSGKTTVLVNRIANMILFGDACNSTVVHPEPGERDVAELEKCIREGDEPSPRLRSMLRVDPVKPWNILAITFTNKAAGELKSRLAAILGEERGGDVNASTFHSACVRILRREADKLGFPKSFTIYDSDDQKRVLKDIYKSANIDDKFLPIRAASSAIGHLKDRMVNPAEAAESANDARAQLVAQIYAAYAKALKAAGALDFDDLIYYTVRLLREFPEVREYYQSRFAYILVDEYQDTSVAQFMLVNLLCGPAHNLCVVGDDDQSIYRFRGATIENILSFEQNFPGAKVIRLEQNYRSTANILNAANCVIQNNQGRKGKTLWTDSGEGSKIQYFRAANEQEEAAHIAEIIRRHEDEGIPLGRHTVLYRMNAQSSPIENYFTRAGIPHKILGGLRFNDRKEVRDIHAYMSIVANPQDDLRLRRIINEPARKIGDTTVSRIADIAEGLGLPMLEVIRQAAEYPSLSRAAGALAGFYKIYEALVQAAEELPLERFAAEVPEITGYNAMLKALGDEGLTRLENIGQLVSNVKTYADMAGAEGSLEGYLEEIALIADIDNYDEAVDAVILMTMHSAKGLEFPYVFIVGMEEGIFPGEQSRWAQEDLEEERRLCYVGITRAKKELYLSNAAQRMIYGQTRRYEPSRFLDEIEPDLLEVEESTNPLARGLEGELPFGGFGLGAAFPGGGSAGGGAAGGYLNNEYNRRPAGRAKPAAAQGGDTSLFGMQQAAARPGAAQPRNLDVEFAPGDRVEHNKFGRGVVHSVTPVAGDRIIEIEFETVGRKKTMANYTKLTKV